MAKYDYRKLKTKEREKITGQLVKAFSKANSKQEVQQFIDQLLTPSEKIMLGRRIQVARLLIRGYTYVEIRQKLKAGISTIKSVDGWLEMTVPDYQELRDWYRKWIYTDKAKKPEKKRSGSREPDMFGSFASVRHRYAGHFLLLNLLLDSNEE
ncbi:MAG: Trp family transcriptional regulator [Candidatus Andersenbacteria bacterium]|nr:Trp family transcriptional regulator [bacterium]MDZ4225826.1 Trp family transcriptional regulator [Candidatus Andersenbacteria bacterium]